jgi:hypothetical protein
MSSAMLPPAPGIRKREMRSLSYVLGNLNP